MIEAREVDFLNEAILLDPFPTYAQAFAEFPVAKVPGQPIYGVFSNHLVAEVLRRVDDFSNEFRTIMEGRQPDDPEIKAIMSTGWPSVDVLLTTDPPAHGHYRKLVNMAFSKPRVAAIADDIRRIAISLIDGFVNDGRCNFIRDFAVPLPVHMIAGQLGLSDVPHEAVRRWSDAVADRLGAQMTRERELQCAREVVEFQHVMMSKIDERRHMRQNDLLSDLVYARIDDERALDDSELLSILQQLMAAGNESTASTFGLGLLALIRNPAQMAEVRADASKIPNMVEEILRLDTPSPGTWRVVKRETELGGVRIPADSLLVVRLGAANRDPDAFAAPDSFDLSRRNSHTHLAFGRGIHTCVGNMLARRELAIGFAEVLRRMDNIRLDEGETIAYVPNMITRGLAHLNIRFDPIGD